MEPTFPTSRHCPYFQASFEFLGRRWTASILRAMLDGPVRFTDLLEVVPRLSTRLLSQRLDELVKTELVVRVPGEAHPSYQLSAKGRDLQAVFAAVEEWNSRWIQPPSH